MTSSVEQEGVHGASFDVHLLGPFGVSQDSAVLDVGAWRPQIARLFRLIATSPDLRRSRDDIMDLLWPDALPESAARNLGFALHMLRRSLEGTPAPILSERGWVVLNPACQWTIDLCRFEELARDGLSRIDGNALTVLEAAAALHRGEPLPLDRYEDWAQPVRDRVQRAWRDVCMRLAQLRLEERLHDDAIGWIERALESDPLDEEAVRFLLQSLREAGRRAEALRRYNQFADLLRNELDVEPDPETCALAEEMRTEQPTVQATRPRINLPEPTSRLLGRAREITAIAGLLRREDVRLVTLHGTGGAGKTRLSLEVARGLAEEFPDGVFLVALASLAEPSLVVPAIGRVLGIVDAGEQPLVQSIIASIGAGRMLLLLDNFEHLIAAGTDVSHLLASCSGLTVLVTSRQRLHISGEHTIRVPALEIPSPRIQATPETILTYSAVQLFIQRAEASDPDFKLTCTNAVVIAAICRRLDGLPLAIELAAARAALLPPPTLLARLEDASGRTSLRLLASGPADMPQRHQALRNTIGWSYDLLTSDEQRLFRCLSVFAGGGTLEAIEAVYDDEEGLPTLEGIDSLMERSLVLRATGAPRYFMLETIRAYSTEQLEATNELEAARHKHAEYYLGLTTQTNAESQGPDQADWYERLEQDHNNIRTALRWCLDSGERELALQIGSNVWGFWWTRGYLAEGRRWLDEILERNTDAALSQRYLVLTGAGTLASTQGEYVRAATHFGEVLRLFREAAGLDCMHQGLAPEEVNRGTASALNNLGTVAQEQGDHDRARAFYEEALPLVRKLGNQYGVAVILNNLGVVAGAQKDLQRAQHYYEESLAIRRELGDTSGIGMTLTNLAEIVAQQGDHVRAARLHGEGLGIGHELGDMRLISACLEGIAVSSLARDSALDATHLFGAADSMRVAIGNPIPPTERGRYEGWLRNCEHALGQAAFEGAWRRGREMQLEAVIGEGLRMAALHEFSRPPSSR